jgi:hypothetical protein
MSERLGQTMFCPGNTIFAIHECHSLSLILAWTWVTFSFSRAITGHQRVDNLSATFEQSKQSPDEQEWCVNSQNNRAYVGMTYINHLELWNPKEEIGSPCCLYYQMTFD